MRANSLGTCRTYSDYERRRLSHSLRTPATPAAAPRSPIVAGSGTEWTGSDLSFGGFSGLGGFSALDFEESRFPWEANAAGEGISIPRIATRPNDLESFIWPSDDLHLFEHDQAKTAPVPR